MIHRSYLFAPGHNERILAKVFEAGADAVILDLEDAVPPDSKERARAMVREALASHPAWVRVNAAGSHDCELDLRAVADLAAGIRIPKVESAREVEWVLERAPGRPLICAIETARGVCEALAIASCEGVANLALGAVDMARDLGVTDQGLELLYVRSHLVVTSRAAGIDPPIDGVHVHLDDAQGLRRETEAARRLGFFGKSVLHPKQLPTIHDVFTPSEKELAWAREVVDTFERAGGQAAKMPNGEFVDLPVASRARLLQLVGATRASPP